jgi:pSer/pThr/pTyr-binding forkhead associated (FHA) protein
MSQNQEPDQTRLAPADETHTAVAARKRRPPAAANGPPPPGAAARAAPAAPAEAQRERPLQRPPMALLCVLDDGRQDGEWVRLRADRTSLGRSDADVRIPHDVQMSARHAEIVREATPAGWRWLLQDCGSTNGTYVRIGSTALRNYNEFLIGQGRYRFEAAMAPPQAVTVDPAGGTQMPQPGVVRALVPSLVELTAAGPVQRFPFTLAEYWVGSDPRLANIVRPDDPFLDAQHARFYRDKAGQWHAANNASLNGLWLRVKAFPLGAPCQFRLGEQRFVFRGCD